MLAIPAGLDAWDPHDAVSWLIDLAADPQVTDAEYDRAQAAVNTALLGEDLAAAVARRRTP